MSTIDCIKKVQTGIASALLNEGCSVEVTMRSGNGFTFNGRDQDVRRAVAFVERFGLMKLDEILTDDECGTFAYLTAC